MSIAEQLQTIAENVPKVYEAGQKSEYDLLWDAIQTNGAKVAYIHTFYSPGWNDETFKPKYDMRPTNAEGMFRAMRVTDLKACLENSGVVLDTSACTNFEMMFYYGTYGHIPEIDTRSATALTSIFCGADVHTIDKWILKEDGTQTFNQNTFAECKNLENLVVEGVIGKNLLNFSHCTKLTHDSLLSILNALKDYSADTSGEKHTITLGTTNLAKLTDAEKAIATEKGWTLA